MRRVPLLPVLAPVLFPVLGLIATTTAARADGPEAAEVQRSAWEADVFAGYGQLAFPAMDTTTQRWSNGGPAFALSAAYRGLHFTHPFLDLSYVPILSSGSDVNTAQPGGGGVETVHASNSTWAWGLAFGPGWDIDWFRIRAGVGLYDVFVKTDVSGQPNTVAQVGLGFLGSVGAMLWRREPFAIGIEARIVGLQAPTSGIYQSMWSAGVSGRWDFVRR